MNRADLIKDFQNKVWNEEFTNTDEVIIGIYKDLAYELDFYEATAEIRKEDTSYYADNRLIEEVKLSLALLKEI
jgi:hypothetical protein